MLAQLKLFNLISPALPIGGFAYSQGTEYAIDAGWLTTAADLKQWWQGLIQYGLTYLELPILLRCAQAWQQQDQAGVAYWNQLLIASRETAELRQEEYQLGQTLQRLLHTQTGPIDSHPDAPWGYTSLFALALVRWQIPINAGLLGFAWSWLENQIAVAQKTLPLGQTDGQSLLQQLMPTLENAVLQASALSDDEIGYTLPGQINASCHHENQYSRLFRS